MLVQPRLINFIFVINNLQSMETGENGGHGESARSRVEPEVEYVFARVPTPPRSSAERTARSEQLATSMKKIVEMVFVQVRIPLIDKNENNWA